MPKINVAKPFKLNLGAGRIMDFIPGFYTVEKEVADHWFTQAHLVGADDNFVPAPGSFEYAQAQRQALAEQQAAAEAKAAEDAAKAEEERKANEAIMMQKTQEAIAQSAMQAQAVIQKDDPVAAPAVQDIPNPLSVSVPSDEPANSSEAVTTTDADTNA